jgi:putative spermidine/putrescine transport system substrate-binding protein
MKRTSLGVISVLAVATFALVGCSSTSSSTKSTADAKQTLTLFTDSDVNVQALWQKTLIPQYEKANPNITLKFTAADPSTDTTQLAKLAASVKTKRDPAMDIIIDAGFLPDANSAGLLTPISASNVPGIANVDTAVIPGKGEMPYRGSSVVLAYNSDKLTAPTTLKGVLAWIAKNPGKFTYNSPSTGGSGQGFVQAVLDSKMTSSQTKSFVTGYPASKETQWDAGFAALKALTPSIYQQTYPNGNQAVLNLLANGTIDMTPTWSDMFLSSKAAGTLSDSMKAISVTDPALPGGVSSLAVTKNSTHQKAALKLLNWVLQPTQQAKIATTLSGYPAISLDKLPASAQKQFDGLETSKLAPFFSAQSAADMSSAWQKQVP